MTSPPPSRAPLFRDPVTDGAADPTVVAGPDGRWWMFYTQRRPADPGPGVRWVHGSRIGVAHSVDGGASWVHGPADSASSITGTKPPAAIRLSSSNSAEKLWETRTVLL